MKAKELFKKFVKWFSTTVVDARLDNEEKGYDWAYKDIEYKEKLQVEQYQKFFDRQEHNTKYKQRYEDTNPSSKKPYCWYETEINLIYSFHKCFAMRNQTRLQAYRNDLSQKGKRTKFSVNASLGKFEFLKELGEEKR